MQNVTSNAMSLPQMLPMLASPQAATAPVMVTPQSSMLNRSVSPMTLGLAANPLAAQTVNPLALGMPAMNPMAMSPYGQPSTGYPMMFPANAAQGMPAGAAQAVLGSEAGEPPSTLSVVLKNALAFGALGGALGAVGCGLFLPGGPILGGIVGGLAGAVLGAIRGVRTAKRTQEEYRIMMQTAPDAAAAAPVPVHVAKPKKTKAKKAAASKKVHVVKSGDTLSTIAKRHKTTVQKLHTLNKSVIGANASKISVGMKLKLPA